MKEGKDIATLEKETGMKVLFYTCEQVFSTEDSNENFNIVYDMKNEYHESETKLIYPTNKRTILGSVSGSVSSDPAEENQRDFVYPFANGAIVLRVIEMRSRITESLATGLANLSIPKWAISSFKVAEYYIPSSTKVHKFLGFITANSKKALKPLFPSVDSEGIALKRIGGGSKADQKKVSWGDDKQTELNPIYEVEELGPLNDSAEYDEVDEEHAHLVYNQSPAPKSTFSSMDVEPETRSTIDEHKPDMKFRESHYFLK